jgi:CYTH domain-containing protein
MRDAGFPKYALAEFERRFLVPTRARPDLSGLSGRRIEDLYVDGSRLRLRHVSQEGAPDLFKLCKKYHALAEAGSAVGQPITNIYLDAGEYFRLMRVLTGSSLVKTRYSLEHGGRTWCVDVFSGSLSGLVLAELEAPGSRELAAAPVPDWCGPEVTGNPAFEGAVLARYGLSPDEQECLGIADGM